jgi:hypothetical protein
VNSSRFHLKGFINNVLYKTETGKRHSASKLAKLLSCPSNIAIGLFEFTAFCNMLFASSGLK